MDVRIPALIMKLVIPRIARIAGRNGPAREEAVMRGGG